LAKNPREEATPLALVVAVVVVVLLVVKTPLGPEEGAWNVTTAF
jgi:hypothetical protein